MKLRSPAELRAIAETAARDHRDPLQAIYDAGRMDATPLSEPPAHTVKAIVDEVRRISMRRRTKCYLDALAEVRGFSPTLLLRRERFAELNHVRAELAWILRHAEKLSYPAIAAAMNRKDHVSSLHAVRAVEARIAAHPELREELLGIARAAVREADVAPLRSVA